MTTVHDYETGAELEGEATDELVEASRAERSGTGAVLAYREGDTWHHVLDSLESTRRLQGYDVRTVYVMD